MINSHWGVPGVYLKWSILTEVYLTCTLDDQLTLRCTWLMSAMINSHWGLPDLHLKWLTITEVYLFWILNYHLSPVPGLYLKRSIHPGMYLTGFLNDQFTLRCTWLVPYMINSHRGVLDLYLRWSNICQVFLTCTWNDQLSIRCTWFIP
jgi:hypothetical protein